MNAGSSTRTTGDHPCEYCGTILDENGEVESTIPACGPRMPHYAAQCREYVFAALASYKAALALLVKELGATPETALPTVRLWAQVIHEHRGKLAASRAREDTATIREAKTRAQLENLEARWLERTGTRP